MGKYWGFTVMHHGLFPNDWVKPGGPPTNENDDKNEDGYHQTKNEV